MKSKRVSCTLCLLFFLSERACAAAAGGDDSGFQCADGSQVPWRRLCDGPADCADGSDETRPLCSRLLRAGGGREPGELLPRCEAGLALQGDDPRAPACAPDCGRLGAEATPLVVRGEAAPYGVHPWVAALYVRQDGAWRFWCGGSLVSEVAVLTGPGETLVSEHICTSQGRYTGHCVWKTEPENVRIALGKYYRDYNKKQDLTQFRDVERIVLPAVYNDAQSNYGSDIAVLVLAAPVRPSAAVRPVCLDEDGSRAARDLAPGSLGTVAGWGRDENDSFSDTLRLARLPVADMAECVASQPRDFRKYVTFTSFCAGPRNGTGVCNGDSGGGLVFPGAQPSDAWVLHGVVSLSPRRSGSSYCDLRHYTVFTKVSVYVKWIKSVLWSPETATVGGDENELAGPP